jgi:predicted metal-dependent HD superfamily phosphohydrolase
LNIHLEYAWIVDEVYRQARMGILRGFLERPFIYRTQPMIERYERQARENLEREIVQLSS